MPRKAYDQLGRVRTLHVLYIEGAYSKDGDLGDPAPVSASDLVERLGLTRATVYKLVHTMYSEGLLTHPRHAQWLMSPKGREFYEQHVPDYPEEQLEGSIRPKGAS